MTDLIHHNGGDDETIFARDIYYLGNSQWEAGDPTYPPALHFTLPVDPSFSFDHIPERIQSGVSRASDGSSKAFWFFAGLTLALLAGTLYWAVFVGF